ncbi:MAG: PP2C family protein-serine/threonine phosphatase [Lachnospiraceae bacterium]|nr:PP2C family protein-serine/threonine phosphatase [Lachnospiraceae bacterium]
MRMKRFLCSLRFRVPLMITVFVVLMELCSVYYQYQNSTDYLLRDLHHEGSLYVRTAAAEMGRYSQIDWLCDYWEEHYGEMDLIYNDQEAFTKKERWLRTQYPFIGEFADVDDVSRAFLDDEGKRVYAEICYARLCRAFDRLKSIYKPVYLYSFRVTGDEFFFLVTGTKEGEKRISAGGELYELGTTTPYNESVRFQIEQIYRTGASPDIMGNDQDMVTVYEPVLSAEGEVAAIVGVAISGEELLDEITDQSNRTFARSLILILVAMTLISVMLHITVLKPLAREQEIMERYETNKDGRAAVESLSAMRTYHGEVESLAESFSGMVTELDRYLEEIVSVTEEKERLSAELNIASRIQAEMLPREFPAFPERQEFDLYASMTPAKYVGGDFYDYFLIDEDHLALVIADVSGKGVPAALFMMISMTMIRDRTLAGGATPAQILSHVNDRLCSDAEDQLFVTVWMGILTISTGGIVCANGGHEYPAVGRKDAGYELIKTKHGPPLGVYEGAQYQDEEITLTAGDSLFLYTDGVPEAHNDAQELFGEERMTTVLNSHADASPQELLEEMKRAADTFAGKRDPFDDLTMLAIRLEKI